MGTATNQIATEKDLYYSGFTNFASSGPSATIGVTYGDIENLKSNGFIETSYKNHTTISPNLITGEGQTFTDTYSNLPVSSDNKFYYITICEYDITRLSAYDKISILDGSDGMYNIDVRAYGTAATHYYAYTYLCIGDSHPTTLGQSTNTAKFSQTHYVTPAQNSFINFSGCIHHALGGVTDNITNFKGKNKLYWRLYIDKAGVGLSADEISIKNNNSVYGGRLVYHCPNKLIKYSSCAGPDKSVRQPWHVKISEGVTGATRANKITFYYSYVSWTPEHDGVTNLTHIKIGEWDYGSNISGSAEADILIETNPFYIMKDADHSNMSGAYLYVECGTTNNKLNFYYKLRSKNTVDATLGTWDSSYTLTASNTDDTHGGWDPHSFDAIKVPVGTEGPGDKYFLETVRDYNGIEFYIDNK